MLLDPDLVARIRADIERIGVVGLSDEQLVVFFSGVSAKAPLTDADGPVSVLIRGRSSTGKSQLLRRVTRFFPPEAVVNLTEVTAKGWLRFPDGALAHRAVFLGERHWDEGDTGGEATRILRELMSEHTVSQVSGMQDEYGRGQSFVVKGPIALLQSTAAPNVNSQDLSRMLPVHLQPTDRDYHNIADRLQGFSPVVCTPEMKDRILAVHHAAQRMLAQRQVLLPRDLGLALRERGRFRMEEGPGKIGA